MRTSSLMYKNCLKFEKDVRMHNEVVQKVQADFNQSVEANTNVYADAEMSRIAPLFFKCCREKGVVCKIVAYAAIQEHHT